LRRDFLHQALALDCGSQGVAAQALPSAMRLLKADWRKY
jgi:hypothetical protein